MHPEDVAEIASQYTVLAERGIGFEGVITITDW